MNHIPNFLTHAKMQSLGRDSNYIYLDETANLELGSAGKSHTPEPTPLSEVKEKIEQYLNHWKDLDYPSRVNLGSNIETINAKIRKRDENFERSCSGSCLSYFGVGLIGEIRDSQSPVHTKTGLEPSRVSTSSGGLNVQEPPFESVKLLGGSASKWR